MLILCAEPARIHILVRRGNDQPAPRRQNASAFVEKPARIGYVLDGFKRNHHVYAVVGQWNLLSAAYPRVEPVFAARVRAGELRHIYSHNLSRPGLLKRCRAVSFSARYVQHTLSCDSIRREDVSVHVFPERTPI